MNHDIRHTSRIRVYLTLTIHWLSAFQGGEQYISSRSSPTSTAASSAREEKPEEKKKKEEEEKHKRRHHKRHGSRTSSFMSETSPSQSEEGSVASLGPVEMLPRWRERVTSPPSVPRLQLESASAPSAGAAHAPAPDAADSGAGIKEQPMLGSGRGRWGGQGDETATSGTLSAGSVQPTTATAPPADTGRAQAAPPYQPKNVSPPAEKCTPT